MFLAKNKFMKILIFSDAHLTAWFNLRKFDFLAKIISEADRVIINGDFWDGYLTSFDKFVKSDWSRLFPILKAKKAIYIYGNHDKTKWCDTRVNLFSDQQQKMLKIKFKEKELIIEHGHRLKKAIGDKCKWMTQNKVLCNIALYGRQVFTRLVGPDIVNITPPVIVKHRKMKAWAKKKLKDNQILIAGHSHRAYFGPDEHYINTGFINGTHAQYVIIDEEQIELVRTGY